MTSHDDKLAAAKRFLGNRYVLARDYTPQENHATHARADVARTFERVRQQQEREAQAEVSGLVVRLRSKP